MDTVKRIVVSLTDTRSGELAEELAGSDLTAPQVGADDDDEDDLRSVSPDVRSESTDNVMVVHTPAADDHEDWEVWTPEPWDVRTGNNQEDKTQFQTGEDQSTLSFLLLQNTARGLGVERTSSPCWSTFMEAGRCSSKNTARSWLRESWKTSTSTWTARFVARSSSSSGKPLYPRPVTSMDYGNEDRNTSSYRQSL